MYKSFVHGMIVEDSSRSNYRTKSLITRVDSLQLNPVVDRGALIYIFIYFAVFNV